MWNRVASDRLLEHPTRRAILDVVRDEPGIPFTGLLDRLTAVTGGSPLDSGPVRLRESSRVPLGVAHGSLDWHLRVLEKARHVVSIRSGRFRRYYPSEAPWTTNLAAYAFLQSTNGYGLATLLLQASGQTLIEIRARFPAGERIDVEALRHQVGRFVRLGLVETNRRPGFRNVYHALPQLTRIVQTLDAIRRPASFPLNQPKQPQPGPLARPAFLPLTPGAAPVAFLPGRSLV